MVDLVGDNDDDDFRIFVLKKKIGIYNSNQMRESMTFSNSGFVTVKRPFGWTEPPQ